MKVVSTNISKPKRVFWRVLPVKTGIFKEPISGPIELGEHDVKGDAVVDRKHHGGLNQACYLYSADHYAFWKELYPDKELPFGMFGENLTVDGLDESNLHIGDIFQLGECKIQITQPREPCFKLGIRFNDQGVLKKMISSGYCGTYVRILGTGKVVVGDQLELLESQRDGLTITEVFNMIYAKSITQELRQKLLSDTFLPDKLKVKLVSRHGAN
ncbi:MAG: MOSC domain-containing protein [Reichenbachiella sp.]